MTLLSSAIGALVLVVAAARASGAQTAGPWAGNDSEGRDVPTREILAPACDTGGRCSRLIIPSVPLPAETRVTRPWLAPVDLGVFCTGRPDSSRERKRADVATLISSFRFGSMPTAARRNVATTVGVKKVNRTFVPIPLVAWHRRLPIGRSTDMALNPSIVFGRRLTIAPELSRGGRTMGVAVEMKVRFGPHPVTQAPAKPTSALFSQLLATVVKRGGG